MISFSYFRDARRFMPSDSRSRALTILGLFLWCMSSLAFAQASPVAPNFTAAFSPTTIAPGATSTVTFTIANTEANNEPLSDVGFSVTLPTGMTVNTSPNASSTCNNAQITATAGAGSITMAGVRLGSNITCTLSVDVTSSTAGTHTMTTGTLSGSNSAGSHTFGTANADLTVSGSLPTLNLALSAATVNTGDIVTFTYTIDNTNNGSNITFTDFSHVFGNSGITPASTTNFTHNCPLRVQFGFTFGSVTLSETTLTVNDAEVNAGASCTISFDVVAPSTPGEYALSTGALSSNAGTSGAASALLTVQNPISSSSVMAISFSSFASPGDSISLNFNLTNVDRDNDITGLGFTADLNAALSGLAATALPDSGFCGSGSTISGTSTVTVSSVSLASGASCSFSITVLVPANAAAGNYTMTTSTINMTRGTATTSTAASTNLRVQKAPTLSMAFLTPSVTAGSNVTLRLTLTNTDTTNAASAISFAVVTATELSGFFATTFPTAGFCGAGSTLSAYNQSSDVAGFQIASSAPASLTAGANCTFDVVMTVPSSAQPGTYSVSSTDGIGTVSGSELGISDASASFTVVAGPSLSMGIRETSITPGGTINIDFSMQLSGNSTTDATGIGFTVDLNAALAGLTAATVPTGTFCGSGGAMSGASSSTLTASGLSLTAGSTCTFSVTATIPTNATAGTYSLTTSTVSATVASTSVTSDAASASIVISGLTFSHQYLTSPAVSNEDITLRYTITNDANAQPASSIQFSHSLSNVVSGFSTTGTLPSTPCNSTGTISGTTNISFSGASLGTGESCSFDVTVKIPDNTAESTYISVTSAMSATVSATNTSTEASSAQLEVVDVKPFLTSTAGSPTSTSPIPLSINFNRTVAGFDVSDLNVGNGSAGDFSGSGSSYTANITPTAAGTVTVDIAANSLTDATLTSEMNVAATQFSIEYETTPSVVVPTLAIGAPSLSQTTAGPATYSVTYTNADQVILTDSAVTLNKTGTANASVAVTDGTTSTPTVTLSSITGDGTLGISIAANTGRSNTGGASGTAGPSSTFTVDNTSPTVTISDAVADSVNAAFTATFTFSEAVTGFTISDITATNASLTNFSAVSSTVYTVTVTPTSEGTVSLDVAANVAVDALSLGNTAATQHSVTYDTTAPTVSISTPSASTNAPFTATFNFNENVTGFAVGDISVTNGSAGTFNAVSATQYTAVITPTTDGAVNINVSGNVAVDAANNGNTAATQSTVTYDTVSPSLSISATGSTLQTTKTVTFTFSEDMTGFAVGDIAVTNGSAGSFSTTSAQVYTAVITADGDGAVTVNVTANSAADAAGNGNTAGNQLNLTADSTAPTLVISGPTADVNAAFTATFTFSEAVTGFDVNDISLGNGSAGSFNATSALVYTAQITPTSDGSVTVNVAASAAIDAASNNSVAAAQYSVNYDATNPTVSISTPSTSANAPYTATFNFSENVTGFTLSDINVTNGAASVFAGSNSQYTATITPTAEGAVTLNVSSNAAVDSANNGNTAASQNTVTYDTTAPTLLISADSTTLQTTATVTFTFSEDVTGFELADISVSNGSAGSFTTVSARVYTAVITATADGAVTVDVAADRANDAATNGNIAGNQLSMTADSTAPTVAISGPTTDVNAAFNATFTFSEAVSGFDLADISVGNGSASGFITTSSTVYSAVITPSAEGSVTVNVAANVANDTAGNGNTAATQYSVNYDITLPTATVSVPSTNANAPFTATFDFSENVTGLTLSDITVTNGTAGTLNGSNAQYTAIITPTAEGSVSVRLGAGAAFDAASNGNSASNTSTVNYDTTAPTLNISASGGTSFQTTKSVTFVFSEDMTGFTVSDIAVSNGSAGSFVAVNALNYTAVITASGDGAVTVDVPASSATDAAGNGNVAGNQLSLTADATAPTLSIVGPTTDVNSAFTTTFTFSEAVSGFAVSDINVGNGSATSFNTISSTQYTAVITPTADGSVTVDVPASAASDTAGNGNTAATQFSVNNDTTLPTVTVSAPSANSNAPYTATFNFSENVTGFALSDITVTNGSAGTFSGSNSQYTALITPATEGSVSVSVVASVAVDGAGNGNIASNISTVNYDTTSPTLNISATGTTLQTTKTVTFTFSEDMTGFAVSDITVNNGSAGTFVAVSSNIYTAVITASGDGAVTVDVPASSATDAAGNNNVAGNQLSLTADATAPTLTITGPTVDVNSNFTATFTFNEAVTGFAVSDITVTNGSASSFVTVSTTQYTAVITPTTDGSVTVDVPASAANDTAGNGNVAATQFSVNNDVTQPTIGITTSASTTNSTFTATFTFSENVTGFTLSDITVSNGAASNFSTTSSSVYSATITPSSEGTVSIDVAASVAVDAANNSNTAAAQSTVDYDTSGPTLSISSDRSLLQTTETVTFTFNEDVTGFTIDDISVSNGSAESFASTSARIYTAVITATSDGTINVNVPASVALDTAGNGNIAGNQLSLTADATAPTLASSTPADNTNGVAVDTNLVLQFSEAISFNTTSTGTFQVVRLSDAGAEVETTTLTLSSGSLTGQGSGSISGTTLTIDLTQNLTAGGSYAIKMSADLLQDSAGNAFAGITNVTDLNFVVMPSVVLSVDTTQLIEELTQTATATVALQGPSSAAFNATSDVTVTVSFNGSTATQGSDYTLAGLTNNAITISSGTNQSTFTVTAINDAPLADEPEQIVMAIDAISTSNAIEVLEQQVTVSIVENAVPEATNLPTSLTITEDTKTDIDLSSIVVVDAEGDSLELTLTLDAGTLQATVGVFNGATVTSPTAASIRVAGAASAINTYLDDVTAIAIIPPENSVDPLTLSLSVTDGTETSTTQTISVGITAVNDTPRLTSGTVNTFDIAGGTVSNATTFTETENNITMTVTLDSGNLVAADLDTKGGTSGNALYSDTVSGTSQATVTFSQSVNLESAVYFFNVGAAPTNITFTPTGGTGSPVTLSSSDFTVDSAGTTVQFTGWTSITGFTITSTSGSFAPGLDTLVFSAPLADLSFQEDAQAALNLSGLSLSDGDSTSLTLTIEANGGTLALANNANRPAANASGLLLTATVTLVNNVITITGTAAEINAYLAATGNILYTPPANSNGNESSTITISVNDNSGSGAVVVQTIAVDVAAVNDAPVITNLNTDVVNFTQAGSAVLIDSGSNASVSDIDDTDLNGGSMTVTVSSGGNSAEDLLSFGGTQVTLAGTATGDNVLVNGTVVGTLGNVVTEGNDLVVNFNANASFSNVGLLLNAISYRNTNISSPLTTSRVISVSISDGDDSSETVAATVSFTPLDRDTSFTFATPFSSITPQANSQNTAQTAVIIQIVDSGTDGVPTTFTAINFSVGGTLVPENMSYQMRQVQNSNGATVATYQGQYANGVLRFSDQIVVANGSSDVSLVLETWFNSSAGLVENAAITFGITPTAGITVLNTGSQIGTSAAQTPVSLALSVNATELRFNTEPADSVSGVALGTQPVVHATDSFGNVDTDFTGSIVLTEFSAGTLLNETVQAVSGVANFTGLNYFASTDNESFVLSADVVAGSSTALTPATSNSVISQVVATNIVFAVEPEPTSINTGVTTQFMTVPVLQALDAQNLLDQDYNQSVVLSEVNGLGEANITVSGDLDAASETATLAFSSGSVTFSGLAVNYAVAGQGNEIFNLQASSGSLSSATSQSIVVNDLPRIEGLPTEIIVVEDQPSGVDLSAMQLSDADGTNLTLSISVSSGSLTADTASGTANNVTINGSGTDNLSIAGTVSGILAFLDVADVISYLSVPNDDTDSTMTILANDGQIDSAASSINLSITPVNDAPTISGDGSASIAQGTNYEFIPTATDIDGDTLVFSIENQPDWLDFDETNGRLFGTSNSAAVGTFENIIISVFDGAVTASLDAFSITVSIVNDAPVISGIPGTSVEEDTFYSFTPQASDGDGNSLTFSIANAPGWANFDTTTGQLSGTPGNSDVGDYVGIIISVTDGLETASLPAFTLSVINVNDAPEISGTPQTSVIEGELYSFQASASDIDSTSLTFSIVGMPGWATFDELSGLLTGTPGTSDVGNHPNIVISVSDGQLEASLPAFNIEVVISNSAPTVESQTVSVNEDNSINIQLVGNDNDGDALSFRIVDTVASGNLTLTGSVATFIPESNVSGVSEQFTFVANDGNNDSAVGTVTINILPVNDAPIISGTPATGVKVLNSYVFIPEANDVEGDTLTFGIQNAPGWSQFNPDTGELSGQPGVTDAGVYGNVMISVSDGDLVAQLPAFNIEVVVNTPPVISGAPAVVTAVAEAYNFTPTVSDGDGDALTFSVTNLPIWATFNSETGTISGTPGAADVGSTSNILITVTDGVSSASLPSFAIRVCDVCDNEAPVISGNPLVAIVAGSEYLFTPESSDADNDTLEFSVENLPSWAVFDAATGSISGTPQDGNIGIFSNIIIRVTDGQDSVALSAFNIEVLSANEAPSLTGIPASSVFQGERYEFTPLADDVDGDSLTFSILNRPDWAAFNPQTGRLSGTPGANDVGVHGDITIRVTDNVNGLVALDAFSIEVIARNSAPLISGDPRTAITPGVAYLFQPVASDIDGDSLTFSINAAPDWLAFDEQTGQLSGTATEANLGTHGPVVISVSDGQESAALPEFTINVDSTNVAPVASNLDVSVAEDNVLNINAGATDINQDVLTLTVITAPVSGTLSETAGGWVYTPNDNFNGSDNFIFEASDGTLVSEQATVSITVTPVNDMPVATNDTITVDQTDSGTYLLDVLANDSDVDVQTNGDMITLQRVSANFGDATIVNNQIQLQVSPSFFGSVTLEYSVFDEDSLSDTATVELTINGVDAVNAPVITTPADITVNATGLSTKVDLGTATAVDASGNSIPVSLVDGQVTFSPGSHTVYWQAEDSFGNTSTEPQQVNVIPVISLAASEFAAEGSNTVIRVILNGDAPAYPFEVSYELSGTAQANGVDYSDMTGSGVVTFTEGREQTITLAVLTDGEIETDETIIVSLAASQNVSANGSVTVTISENNIAPEVALEVSQNGAQRSSVAQDQGMVSVTAMITELNLQDTVTIDWTSSSLVNVSAQDGVFEFDPTAVQPGTYTVSVYVYDDGNPILDNTASIDIEIVTSFIVLSDTEDTDGDLIPDAQDGLGDDDGDGVPNYLDAIDDCNVIAAQADNQNEFLIESDAGVCMRLGETSAQNESNGVQVVLNNTAGRPTRLNKAGQLVELIANNLPEDPGFENIGGVYDFVIYDLREPGETIRVVIPQSSPLPEGAIYRKFSTSADQWFSFVRDDNNRLFSADGDRGNCPTPGSDAWQLGLKAGAWCVQLQISDGGPNDNDGAANRTILDPGGVFVFVSDNTAPTAQNDDIQMKWNTQVEIDVLGNDSDVDADTLTILRASANIGAVSISNNQLVYVARQGFSGTDSIDYIVSDGNGGTANATVTVTIVGNRAPGAVDDFVETDNMTAIEIDVLANDIDVDNDPLSISSAVAETGEVMITANNTLMYTPEFSFSGLDTVNYEIEDPSGAKGAAQVSVFVNGNEAPVANDDTANTAFETPVTIDVLANDSDADGDQLMVIDASVSRGLVTVNNDNSLTYTPPVNFSGTIVVTYTISDGVLSTTATVTITVAENDVEVVEVKSSSGGGAIQRFMLLALFLILLVRRFGGRQRI